MMTNNFLCLFKDCGWLDWVSSKVCIGYGLRDLLNNWGNYWLTDYGKWSRNEGGSMEYGEGCSWYSFYYWGWNLNRFDYCWSS
mgnify:CR=1 FL=1